MDLNLARIDRSLQSKHSPGNVRIEDAARKLLAGPAVEEAVDRRGRTVFGRAVLLAAAGHRHVHDPTNDAPIDDSVRPGWFFGTCGPIVAHASCSNQNSLLTIASFEKRQRGT